jgi:hypothetical protein
MSFKEMSRGKQASTIPTPHAASNSNQTTGDAKAAPQVDTARKATSQDEPPRQGISRDTSAVGEPQAGKMTEKKTVVSSPSSSH